MKKQIANIKMIKKNPCAYCDRAQNLLNGKDLQFEVIDLTGNFDEILKWKQKTGSQTVPMILINDEFIGGYQELKELEENGELDSLVFEK